MSNLNLPSSDYYETPKELFAGLNTIFTFNIDLAATDQNALLPRYFTEEQDALNQNWAAVAKCAFLNPPFSVKGQKDAFVAKALEEAEFGLTTVMLLPVKSDTNSFHDDILNQPNVSHYFLRGRPKFGLNGEPTKNTGRSPIMIVVFWGATFDADLRQQYSTLTEQFCQSFRPSRKPRAPKSKVVYVYEDLPEVKYEAVPWVEPPAVCEFHTSVDRCKQYNCPPFNK